MGTPFLSVRLITRVRSPPNIRFHCQHKYLPVSLLSGAASFALHFLSRYDGAVFSSAPQSYCFSPWLLHSISLSQGESHYQVNNALICAEGAAFAAAGLSILALALIDLWRKRDADSLHLCLWVIGTFLFSIFFNWSITARTILPMVPAVAILFARNSNWGRPSSAHWRLIAAAGLSLLLAASDFREAQVVRHVTEVFRERFAAELGTVWFQSHWGFQYYLQ